MKAIECKIRGVYEGSDSRRGRGKQPTSTNPCTEVLATRTKSEKTLKLNRPRSNTSVGKGINDGSLKLSVSNGLVDSGNVLANSPVIPTCHTDHAINADLVEPLKVLPAMHLDFQLDPDEFVHLPRLFEVFARGSRSVSAIEERLRELSVESGQAVGEGGAESGDTGDTGD